MNLRQNKEKNAQQMLTGVILTLFIMLLLCTIFTNQDAASVSKLKARQPDKIHTWMMEWYCLVLTLTAMKTAEAHLYFLPHISM